MRKQSLTIIPSRFLGFFKKGRLFEKPSATMETLEATLALPMVENADTEQRAESRRKAANIFENFNNICRI